MLQDIRYLLGTFARRDRVALALLVVGQFVASLMDLLGLAVVLPLMEVLLGADMTQGYLGTISGLLGNPSRESFIVVMAVVMVAAFAVKAVASLALGWWSSGVVIRLQNQTATRLLKGFLSLDYMSYRQSNLADTIRVVDAGVSDAHGKILGGLLSLAAFALSTGAILALLLVVSPVGTAAALLYFGGIVFGIQRVLANRNRRAGRAAVDAAWRRSFALISSVTGFREIRMHGVESHFLRRFQLATDEAGRAAQRAMIYGSAPRYLLEVAAITGIGVLLAVLASGDGTSSIMPVVSLFIAASIKLLPNLSGVTTTLGNLQNGRAGLSLVVESLRREKPPAHAIESAHTAMAGTPPRAIDVSRVSFTYPDGRAPVLKAIKLHVPPGASLAICGASGSGKTTLVDIMLGLLAPTTGSVTYGGRSPTELGAEWRRIVAYVPQDVFLLDASLAANVAFGEDEASWDEGRIIEVLDEAELGGLIHELPAGLDSMLGERGSRLSGGQRQRIGIARALYRSPRVIVLDEATSALDNETEDRVSRAIKGLYGKVTVVVVAHRLSTVRHVDHLVFLKDGCIQAEGTFDEVRQLSADFARLVELGSLDADLNRRVDEEER